MKREKFFKEKLDNCKEWLNTFEVVKQSPQDITAFFDSNRLPQFVTLLQVSVIPRKKQLRSWMEEELLPMASLKADMFKKHDLDKLERYLELFIHLCEDE